MRGLVIVIVVLVSCSKPSPVPAPAELFRARGRVMQLEGDRVEIHHERIQAIRNFEGALVPMESMTMPFYRTGVSLSGIDVGDVVELEFSVHYDADPTLRLARITELPADTALELR